MRKVYILWTGGLDSTYRMIQLSRINVIIQPIYNCGNNLDTKSKYELKAMNSIMEDLKNHPQTKAEILPLMKLTEKVTQNKDISKSYEYLNKKYKIGIQYRAIAQKLKDKNIQAELCLEYSPISKARNTVINEGKLEEINDGEYHALCLGEKTSEHLKRVYGSFIFPVPLFYMTKKQEIEDINKMGYTEIIKKTWFCHYPIFGLPCGHCNPCKDAYYAGLGWRVPKLGYFLGCLFYYPMRLYGKLKRKLFKKKRIK